MDGAVRAAFELVAERCIIPKSVDSRHSLCRVVFSKHVTREGSAVVPVPGKAVRVISSHRVGRHQSLQRPVYKTLLFAALGPGIDAWVAVAAKALDRVPNRRLGYIRCVQRPIPIPGILAQLTACRSARDEETYAMGPV